MIVSYKSLEPWHWSTERSLSFFSICYEYKDLLLSINISIFLNIFLNHTYFDQRTSLKYWPPISCINVYFNYEPSYVTLFSNTNSSSFYLFSLSCSSFVPYSWVFLRYHNKILMHHTFIFADNRLL